KSKKKVVEKKSGTPTAIVHVLPQPKVHFSVKRFVTIFLSLCLVVFILSMAAGGLFYWYIVKDLPSPQNLGTRQVPVSTKIYDRNGVLLYTIYKDYNRTPVSLSEI